MSTQVQTFGTQIDSESRESSQSLHISTQKLVTLQDLLAELVADGQSAMLRTTAGHIANFLNAPIDKIAIEALVDIVPEFRTYLKQRRYKRNAANSYCNYAGVLLRKARELGWVESKPELPNEWQAIAEATKTLGAGSIIRFAVGRGKMPTNFTNDDMNNWAQIMVGQGRSYEYIQRLSDEFRQALFKAGLSDSIPRIFDNWKSTAAYFIPLSKFPDELGREVRELLRWKQAMYVQEKRTKRLRPVSAGNLESAITRLYGFLVNVRPSLQQPRPAIAPSAIRTLVDLVSPDNISAFTDWWLNVRNRKGYSLVVKWGALSAAMKEHPKYKSFDFTWLDDLKRGIPDEPESDRRERKERKYIPYETASDIARRIREQRKNAQNLGAAAVARLIHDELLTQWLVILPWRQRNIRECRVGRKSDSANLFKAEIQQWDPVAKPKWVQDKLPENPHEEFWQYHFRESETKNGREVHSILPRRLVPLLEEYLEHHRSLLVGETEPSTLFLNKRGARFTDDRLTKFVSSLTLRYTGTRVTPHIFRDIFAYWWLRNHPEDYLTVSKKLWHRNIQTTLRHYGSKFDESQADCRVEEWLETLATTQK